MRFLYPQVLLLLLIVPVLIWYYFFSKISRRATIKYSNINKLKNSLPGGKRSKLSFQSFFDWVKIGALILIILAAARPQAGQKERNILTEGYDIMLALDISGSMKAEDFKPKNRLNVAKDTINNFIKGRKSDRIGLVVFAGESFTQSPLTLDYSMLLEAVRTVKFDMVDDGTAIGMAIANAVDRLRYSRAKSKIIILLTDGVNNAGNIDPITAAKLAQAFGIKIYTIGVGTKGKAPFPYEDPIFGKRYAFLPVDIDETTLTKVAQITGGKYFRATDAQTLSSIYATINKLEKTKIDVKEYVNYNEMFYWFLGLAIILLLSVFILENFIFVAIP